MFFSIIKDIYPARPVVVGFKAGKGYGVMWDVDAVGIYACRRRGQYEETTMDMKSIVVSLCFVLSCDISSSSPIPGNMTEDGRIQDRYPVPVCLLLCVHNSHIAI